LILSIKNLSFIGSVNLLLVNSLKN